MKNTGSAPRCSRRHFTQLALSAGFGVSRPMLASAQEIVTALEKSNRPVVDFGLASGDVSSDAAIVWSRCDRPARMFVETAATESFRNARRYRGPVALSATDFTAKLRVTDLPPGEETFYRVVFHDLDRPGQTSVPLVGRLRTAPRGRGNIRFVWSGDTAGQGFGIDESRGGMRTYETIRKLSPHFFVHSGDTIYADNPFPETITLEDGSLWKNIVTEQTSKVAETLDEFRANFRYNLLDKNLRQFNAEIPIFSQWDDHETTNNWYPGEQLLDERYVVKSASLLAARAKRAFFEYMPIRSFADRPQQIFRRIPYGPLLDLFFLDLRSFRGPNSPNRQNSRSEATAFIGRAQLSWLKKSLLSSRATWKVICSDMPLGLIVRDGAEAFENSSNGDGPTKGRELEIADLLQFIKLNDVKNIVWITADVHYAASHFYDPNKAQFQQFNPFWEFVSGPLHAGTFGPGELDNTFGPQLEFCGIPEGMKPNRPPADELQFFGMVEIDGDGKMAVSHYNVAGARLWTKDLYPDNI